ncbi:MAG: hypothetical protein ACRCUY_02830 [Thermoguttaceae bacterium]
MTIVDEHTADLRRRLAKQNPPTYVGGSPLAKNQQNPPTYVGGSPKNTRRTNAGAHAPARNAGGSKCTGKKSNKILLHHVPPLLLFLLSCYNRVVEL